MADWGRLGGARAERGRGDGALGRDGAARWFGRGASTAAVAVLVAWRAGAAVRRACEGRGCRLGVRWVGFGAVGFGAGGRAGAGSGRLPDCQSRRICSRRLKMRAKMAAIRACTAAGHQAHFSCPAHAGRRRPANWSPRESVCASMGKILTNLTPECKGKLWVVGNFFWGQGEEEGQEESSFCEQKEAKKLYPLGLSQK